MSETLDTPYIVSTSYTKFNILNIEIILNKPAKVSIQLLQDDVASNCLYKTIEIPTELYEGWQFDKTQINNYIKTQLSSV